MIKALRLACEKQKHNLLFGPKDINGSSAALIERELLKVHKVEENGEFQLTWFVTNMAIDMLAKIDKQIVC